MVLGTERLEELKAVDRGEKDEYVILEPRKLAEDNLVDWVYMDMDFVIYEGGYHGEML